MIKEALLDSETVPMRIAALYLYYAVYNKQPLQRFSRIRITLSESEKLLAFTKLLLHNRPQPLMIMSRLWSEGAFMLVADPEEVLTLSRKPKDQKVAVKHPEHHFEPLNLRMEMEDLFDEEQGLLGRMEMLEVAYNEMKEDLGGGQGDNQLAPTMVCDTIRKQLGKIQDLLVTSYAFPAPSNDALAAQTKSTRRDQVLEKISAIQRSKNTLPEEPGPSPKKFKSDSEIIVIEDEKSININTSFLYSNPYPRQPSHAEQMMIKAAAERDIEEGGEAAQVKVQPKRQRKTTKLTVKTKKTRKKKKSK